MTFFSVRLSLISLAWLPSDANSWTTNTRLSQWGQVELYWEHTHTWPRSNCPVVEVSRKQRWDTKAGDEHGSDIEKKTLIVSVPFFGDISPRRQRSHGSQNDQSNWFSKNEKKNKKKIPLLLAFLSYYLTYDALSQNCKEREREREKQRQLGEDGDVLKIPLV